MATTCATEHRRDYSQHSANFLAPARIQFPLSLLIRWNRAEGIVKVLLKTLALRSFQISQVMRMIAVLSPSRDGEGVVAKSFQ